MADSMRRRHFVASGQSLTIARHKSGVTGQSGIADDLYTVMGGGALVLQVNPVGTEGNEGHKAVIPQRPSR